MRQNRIITVFSYLLLIVGCALIVLAIDKAAGTGLFFQEQQMETSAPQEKEQESPLDGKPDQDVSSQTSGSEEHQTETEEKTPSGERRKWYTSQHTKKPEKDIQPPEEPKGPPRLILATDIHYLSPKLTDYGEAFQRLTEKDDGKVLRYTPQLTDAFFEEALEYRPDALILSGDLTVNGEKVNHQELAQKLAALQEQGVQVLVIPGNHDINNPNAASYIGEKKEAADPVTPQEFYEIYHSFGYDQAASRDESSLSYRYILDETHWLLMLDSCQYEPYNKVGGKIGEETYAWIRQQYEEAEKAGAVMIPVAHHNLMGESRVYPTECAIEGGEELISILEEYEVPLYLSGHLHLQRIKKYQPEPGAPKEAAAVTEAVTGSLSIAPCQYSLIQWAEDGTLSYSLKEVDVSSWAEASRLTDENLLDFESYSEDFVKQIVSDQIYKKLDALPEDMKRPMASLYGQLNYEYCAGKAADEEDIKNTRGYWLWERNRPDSEELSLINKMIADLKQDNTSFQTETDVN